MDRRGIAVPSHPTLASMTQVLKNLKLMPSAEEFSNAMQVMNSAVHGYEVDAPAAQEAFRTGKKFLAEVRKWLHEQCDRAREPHWKVRSVGDPDPKARGPREKPHIGADQSWWWGWRRTRSEAHQAQTGILLPALTPKWKVGAPGGRRRSRVAWQQPVSRRYATNFPKMKKPRRAEALPGFQLVARALIFALGYEGAAQQMLRSHPEPRKSRSLRNI